MAMAGGGGIVVVSSPLQKIGHRRSQVKPRDVKAPSSLDPTAAPL